MLVVVFRSPSGYTINDSKNVGENESFKAKWFIYFPSHNKKSLFNQSLGTLLPFLVLPLYNFEPLYNFANKVYQSDKILLNWIIYAMPNSWLKKWLIPKGITSIKRDYFH